MKVKIYVDWDYREIITSQKQKDKIMQSYIDEADNDKLAHAGDYLDDLHLSLTEILYSTDDQREQWKKDIDTYIKELAKDEFFEHYEEIEVEIWLNDKQKQQLVIGVN